MVIPLTLCVPNLFWVLYLTLFCLTLQDNRNDEHHNPNAVQLINDNDSNGNNIITSVLGTFLTNLPKSILKFLFEIHGRNSTFRQTSNFSYKRLLVSSFLIITFSVEIWIAAYLSNIHISEYFLFLVFKSEVHRFSSSLIQTFHVHILAKCFYNYLIFVKFKVKWSLPILWSE